ncbi:MAG TPA: mechanosensitive ion channel family protein [Halobacteriales archaeon]|nr:mechanosensitive ion channel family protein [Halobacteriales archaeon]
MIAIAQLAGVDSLVPDVATLGERIAVSVVLLGALFAVGLLASRARQRIDLDSENLERVLNAAAALGMFGLAVVVGAVLVSLWGVAPSSVIGGADPVVVVGQVVLTLAVLVGSYVLTGVVKRFVYEVTEARSGISQHQRELVFRTTQVSVYVLAALVVFTIWGVDLGGLLVGAGFLGIVVGLAARQTLGSLIAGFVLMFARPFEIGDWVQIGDREGIVTEISIVNTRIQTFDGEYAMIPNDTVGSSEVVNRTRKGRLRIQVDVGVDYATDVEEAIDVAVEAMRDVDDVLAVPQPMAVLSGFGDSSIVLNLRFWIDKPSARRKWRAQTAVIAAVKSAFDREGITIPFPQRVVSARSAEAGFRVDADVPDVDLTASDDGAATDE